tara:strand:- start:185 stop:382 length:198 start_codon:yes stop_codon:yes gene_type:complete
MEIIQKRHCRTSVWLKPVSKINEFELKYCKTSKTAIKYPGKLVTLFTFNALGPYLERLNNFFKNI